MIAICFDIHLSFRKSSVLCVHGLRVLHNKNFESTLLSNNIRHIYLRSATFNTLNTKWNYATF